VDRVIDDVARAMTGGDPPADLREAVLARLDRRSPWRWAWLAVPATAAAIVVVTFAVRDRSATVQPTPANPAVAQIVSTPGVNPSLATIPAPPHPRAVSRRSVQTMASIRSLAALPGPPALHAVDIQPDALAIPLLHMMPIATEPIGIRTIEDGSDRRE
jgi:hypothetical protein